MSAYVIANLGMNISSTEADMLCELVPSMAPPVPSIPTQGDNYMHIRQGTTYQDLMLGKENPG